MSNITIQEARKAQGITQEELAKALGITQGAVSQWETGQTHPSFEYLKLLSNALGISLDELISGQAS